MKKRLPLTFLIPALLILCCVGVQAQQSPDQSKAARSKALQLLEDSGHNYSKSSDNVWTVPFVGDNLKEFNVVAVLEQDLLVLVVIIAEKAEYKPVPELLTKLLRMNDEFDRVKIGISDDGNLFLRIDLSLRVLDGQEVKVNIDQIAAAADEAYGGIKSFLTPSKK